MFFILLLDTLYVLVLGLEAASHLNVECLKFSFSFSRVVEMHHFFQGCLEIGDFANGCF